MECAFVLDILYHNVSLSAGDMCDANADCVYIAVAKTMAKAPTTDVQSYGTGLS